jgi:hypothetical protein
MDKQTTPEKYYNWNYYQSSRDRTGTVCTENYQIDIYIYVSRIESSLRDRFSAPIQTGPGAHPALYRVGTGSFPGVKRPEHGVIYPVHLK